MRIPEKAALYIDGEWVDTDRRRPAVNPYTGEEIATVCECPPALLSRALAAAARGAADIAAMAARERASLIRQAAAAVRGHADELAHLMAVETGKPLADGRTEALRSAETLELSAEEGLRIEGAHIPMESSAIGAGKIGVSLRFPVGVVAAITPFNAPVNLTAHKLGPAWAAGNAVVLKSSPMAALTLQRYVEILAQAGIPPGWLQSIQGDEAAIGLLRAPEVDFISFTGSSRIGEQVKAGSGLKRVALELGGNGYTIVAPDADLEEAARTCARNGMRLAGQSCISVQNVCVHRSIYEEFARRVAYHASTLRAGDPLDAATDVGPVINAHSAGRIQGLVDDAVRSGARLMLGGTHRGALVQPTVLADVPAACHAVRGEIFGPVVALMPYDDIQAVFSQINAGPFGLQAGIFTASLPLALEAARKLRMGAVIVNGSSTWRSDQAPYGGVKASGIGREGPRFAIREMTEERFVVFNA
ncbi:2-hydroxymuconic semialdehyde dehydrogenase [Bordetella genomosp. 10]|uniref:2-hydroxymuconic semialdehyde dehydrogenase n=1 Tax=Bordetella genomosp. 10 TaxID=1416804 RepID=A0A261S3E8_9BORD|nr:aldehyde dehydrogenase family protein [Bordetella genomosp. 10]OZI31878.1 2-hydroxymuconic semialdehyde dehydrogenase [Bordetella genomosp. 10]